MVHCTSRIPNELAWPLGNAGDRSCRKTKSKVPAARSVRMMSALRGGMAASNVSSIRMVSPRTSSVP